MAQDFGHVRLCQQNSPNLTKLETGAKTMFVLLSACLGACDLHLFLTKRASRNSSLLWARFGLPGKAGFKACSTTKCALHSYMEKNQ
jgi:hypothetical protein